MRSKAFSSPVSPPSFDAAAFNRRLAHSDHIVALLGQVPDVNYFAKDDQGRFVQADPGFVAMLGANTLDEILGRTDCDFFPAEIAAHFVADDRNVMVTGEPIRQQIEPVPQADRTFEWRAVTKVPLHDATGKIIGVAGVTCRVHGKNASCHPGVFAVMEHIGKHYGRSFTIPDLAKLAKLSPRAFERHFADAFKTSPLRYLNTVRLRAVRHLLITTEDPLADIAEACGFCDQSHMTAIFTRQFGTTPRRYRATHLKAA